MQAGLYLWFWLCYTERVMANAKQKHRTYARNRAASISRRGYENSIEADSTYFLKLIIAVLLGAFWIKFKDPVVGYGFQFFGVPVGLFIGLILIHRFEKRQSDRKIFYAVTILTSLLCLFMPAVIYI
jgi:hypothetical protein